MSPTHICAEEHLKEKMKNILLAMSFLLLLNSQNMAFADELRERAAITSEVSTLLITENFHKLEALANSYRSSRARTESGLWKLTLFYAGISSFFSRNRHDPDDWERSAKLMEKWIALFPKSPTARLSYARMLLNHGWSIRGGGYASTVRPENWRPFKHLVQQTREYLEKYKSVAGSDPYWYEMMAQIAYIQGWPEEPFKALVSEGLKSEPSFYQLYFAAIDYYAPKWGGNAEEIEKFARFAIDKSKSTEGYGMYARVYWYASQTQFGKSLFSDSHVDWVTMKKGIDDVLKKYPDRWNINNFARFSCLARDRSKSYSLIKQIKDDPMAEVWTEKGLFEQCKLWSAGVAA